VKGESNTIRIGNTDIIATYIRGISRQTAAEGAAVFVDSNGKLGTMTTSTRFIDEIKPMDKASEAILTLKPVSFRYKHEIDSKSIQQFGLIAEEVEKVNRDLVGRDEQGELYSVRYEAVNAMLLNEFLKEHRKVEALQASFARQEKDFQATVAQQQKQIEALTAGLQKVSAQLEASKLAPQVVNNP
jgi:Chaperone of endosialidase